eukprot:scaffold5570_cov87-Skeletonema_dohrnii-CCMP3373.AAC.3
MEQQLREKIASQKASIVNLPTLTSIVHETGLTSPETKARARLIKELSDDEEQLELLLESKRVAAVVRLQDELHPPQNSEGCPICLETIKHVNFMTIIRFYCCGGWICRQCSDEREAKYKAEKFDEMFHGRCPLCRERIPDANDHKKTRTITAKHANKGRAWAQTYIGTCYLRGMNGFALDKKKGLQFLKQAADQRDPEALFAIAFVYKEETLERDESKCVYYLKEAADLGHTDAQQELALTYSTHEKEKRLHYTTLAASQGDAKACDMLGAHFMYAECGLTKSLVLAKHYCEKNLEDELSAYIFSLALYQLGLERFERIMEIPGHSPVPKASFWARKAQEGDSPPIRGNATELLSMLENAAKSRCTNCRKEAGCSSFKRCVRCLGAWYCGKECQVQHWKAGHKVDCIKRMI